MKKLLVLLIMLILIFSVSACRNKGEANTVEIEESTVAIEATDEANEEVSSGFQGEELPENEEEKEVEGNKNELTEKDEEECAVESQPEETESKTEIPDHIGDDDMLEPPENSSAGEL